MQPEEHPIRQEKILYPGRAWQYSHPDRLATNAWLFGMSPASVTECRVLELGCGAGQNLIPMAYVLPQARFLGIDVAAQPIEHGRDVITELGLTNIELRKLDIRSFTREFGEFDYIIAHGVYTWVPPDVRDAVLRTLGANLARQGVAYLNYNAKPGGHIRAIMRDMMRYRLRECADPETHIPEAVDLVRAIIDLQPDASPYKVFLKEELERIEGNPLHVLYHDELAEGHTSFYLHEVLEEASRHGLQYLCESRLADVHIGRLSNHIQNVLGQLGTSRLDREQYFDFLVCQNYRRTLLCRNEITLTPTFHPRRMQALKAASSTRPVSSPLELVEGVTARFCAPDNTVMETDDASAKHALLMLNESWPKAVAFDDLLRSVRERMKKGGDLTPVDEIAFANFLASTYAAGFVDLHMWEPDFSLSPGETPRASALARYEAASQRWVTGLRHNNVDIDDPVSVQVLRLLDGDHHRHSLLDNVNASTRGSTLTPDRLEAILVDFGRLYLLEA